MTEPHKLTGDWAGEYYQADQPYPISAVLLDEDSVLSGSMRDGVTDRTTSVFEIAAQAGLAPGADEQIEAHLRAIVPDSGGAPIRHVSHLPEESTLEGWIKGTKVYFSKTYQGVSFGGFTVGEVVVGHQTNSHVVHYDGTLGPSGLEIEGRWWIDANPEAGTRRSEGSFTLRKNST